MIENSLSKKIKCIQINWGGEFRSFTTYFDEQDIQFKHIFINKMERLRGSIDIL